MFGRMSEDDLWAQSRAAMGGTGLGSQLESLGGVTGVMEKW